MDSNLRPGIERDAFMAWASKEGLDPTTKAAGEEWNGLSFAEKKPFKDAVVEQRNKEPSWTVSAQEQHGGTHDGQNIEALARERGQLLESKGQTVRTKADLRRVIETIKRGDETNVDKLTDRIWDRMQAEPEGTSLPRKEFFEFLYDQSFRNEASAIVKKMDKAAGVGDAAFRSTEATDVTPEMLSLAADRAEAAGDKDSANALRRYYRDVLAGNDIPGTVYNPQR
jgi:hypothetical protein